MQTIAGLLVSTHPRAVSVGLAFGTLGLGPTRDWYHQVVIGPNGQGLSLYYLEGQGWVRSQANPAELAAGQIAIELVPVEPDGDSPATWERRSVVAQAAYKAIRQGSPESAQWSRPAAPVPPEVLERARKAAEAKLQNPWW